MAEKRRNNLQMNLPKRKEIKEKYIHNPRSESIMESELYGELIKKGLRFEKQFPIGPFFADLAYPKIMLVVEYDGKKFHDEEKDKQRDKYMVDLGWKVLRVNKESHLFRLRDLEHDICYGPLSFVAEEIDEIFEERRYKFNVHHPNDFSEERVDFVHIKDELKSAYEKLRVD